MRLGCQEEEWLSILSSAQSQWRLLINILNTLVYI